MPLQYKEKEQSLKSVSKKHTHLTRTQRLHALVEVGSNRFKTKIQTNDMCKEGSTILSSIYENITGFTASD
jgi:hypothetical protein